MNRRGLARVFALSGLVTWVLSQILEVANGMAGWEAWPEVLQALRNASMYVWHEWVFIGALPFSVATALAVAVIGFVNGIPRPVWIGLLVAQIGCVLAVSGVLPFLVIGPDSDPGPGFPAFLAYPILSLVAVMFLRPPAVTDKRTIGTRS